MKPYAKSFLTILASNHNFVEHPNKSRIMTGTPAQALAMQKYEVNETIFIDIRNHVRGIGAFRDRGSKKYLY